MNKLMIVLAGLLLFVAGMAVHRAPRIGFEDFEVYETAGALVAHHDNAHLYEGADTGLDPQVRFAEPGSAFARQALALGIGRVRLYVYPPLLADLMAPFGELPTKVAARVWMAMNALLMAAMLYLLAQLLSIRLRSSAFVALTIAALAQFPTLHCLMLGQVTILLACLEVASLCLLRQGHTAASALVLAVATAIKLTPVLIAIPFLVWGEWRWLRAYAGSLSALAVLLCAINGTHTVTDYVLRVVPPMSAGIPDFQNKSLVSAIQVAFLSARHGALVCGKLLSVAALACAVWLTLRNRGRATPGERQITFALFALLSICLSPVAWRHAYVIQVLPLALLWAEQLRGEAGWAARVWLVFASAELATYVCETAGLSMLPPALHGPLALVAPVTGIALVLVRLAQTPRAARSGERIAAPSTVDREAGVLVG